jgi:hypothetical protein
MDNRASGCGVRPEATACTDILLARWARRVDLSSARRRRNQGLPSASNPGLWTVGGLHEVRSVLLAPDAELSAAAAGGPRERHLGAATARWLGGDECRLCAVSLDLFVDEAEVRIDGGNRAEAAVVLTRATLPPEPEEKRHGVDHDLLADVSGGLPHPRR